MRQDDPLLREICQRRDLRLECLERLLKCEQNKRAFIRKHGLKQDMLRVLEEAVRTEDSPQ
jgi:hypothetical protein